jgi:ribonuclease HI
MDKLMETMKLFTDGSVDPQSKVGYGAYLAVFDDGTSLDLLKSRVKLRRFEQTSSTKLELQTLLWALEDPDIRGHRVVVYTDSQNIMGLPARRDRLEQSGYQSKKNKLIRNHELYQKFYGRMDQLEIQFMKVQGHKRSIQKDETDQRFTLVDRATRNALRQENSQPIILSP